MKIKTPVEQPENYEIMVAVGRGVSVSPNAGVAVGVGDGVSVGVCVGVAVAVGVTEAVGVGVKVTRGRSIDPREPSPSSSRKIHPPAYCSSVTSS